MKRLIVDIDGTITTGDSSDYKSVNPDLAVVQKLREYREAGFEIVLFSSRNMRTHNGNLGKINIHTLPILMEWLNNHNVPFDEILMGKPWCGFDGFYVDDRAIRPDEFKKLSYSEIKLLIGDQDL